MKKIILCVLIVFLTACQQSGDVVSNIEKVVDNFKASDYTNDVNHFKKYYDYYVPRDASLYESSSTYSIFLNNKVKILMSVDIARIINTKYYTDVYNGTEVIYDSSDLVYKTKDIYGKSIFELEVYLYEDHYLLNLEMNNANLVAMVKSNYVSSTLDTMFEIATNINVHKNAVIDDFYARGSIDYEKDQVDLFEVIVPSEGRLDALIENGFEDAEE